MLGTILELARRRKIIKENPARSVNKLPEGKQRRFLALDEIGVLACSVLSCARRPMNRPSGLKRSDCSCLPDADAWKCFRFHGNGLTPRQSVSASAIPRVVRSFARLASPPSPCWTRSRAVTARHTCCQQSAATVISLACRACWRGCAPRVAWGVTVHVLRHSFAAAAAEMGFSELTIAGMLGHTVSGVTARYAHVPDIALVGAADRVSGRIATALDGAVADAVAVNPQTRVARIHDVAMA